MTHCIALLSTLNFPDILLDTLRSRVARFERLIKPELLERTDIYATDIMENALLNLHLVAQWD